MIRYAGPNDINQIMILLVDMHAEQGLLEPDWLKMIRTVADALKENRVLVAEKDGQIIGTFGFAIAEVWYSSQRFVGDMWLYVDPAHRKSRAAIKMLNALKADAKERGLDLMVGAVGKKLDGARLFRNFAKCGELFIMRA